MKHSRNRARQSLARLHLAELAGVWGFRRFGPKSRRLRLPRARRAVATLVVLLLLAVTLALSYAMMRSQAMDLRIQQNAGLGPAARQAALTGMTMAMRDMHRGDWVGIEQTVTGSLGAYASYEVTYTTGDESLTSQPDHPDYGDFPYRVTLDATGFAADPSDPKRISTHQVRAVVRLVPRKLADEPSDWPTMQQYTVFQTKSDHFEIDIPCRLEGPVRVQGKLKLALHYPNDDDAWSHYLRHLNAMRLNGQPDYRPFNGPVHLPYLLQEWKFYSALNDYLQVTTANVWVDEVGYDWVKPTSLTSYQIYDGGPVYTIPAIGDTLRNTTLEPDPLSNPLGLYYRDGSLSIWENVTIRGTLFCRDEIKIEGPNVHFEPVEMPALDGEEGSLRLPVATCQKLTVKPAGPGSMTGLVAVFDELRIEKSAETQQFAIEGRVVTRKFFIKEREPWPDVKWKERYTEFKAQDGSEGAIEPYFPEWMRKKWGRDPQPLVTVTPDANPVRYHWKNWYHPVYVPHSDDAPPLDPDNPGLRWNLLEWTDNFDPNKEESL